ncbi:hypothetical protein DFH09DRAFT_1082778 [Mycena vulgaris]|nr:hypothetical protein DFH09DRAFT_1082778 [Mycena vulgaris]
MSGAISMAAWIFGVDPWWSTWSWTPGEEGRGGCAPRAGASTCASPARLRPRSIRWLHCNGNGLKHTFGPLALESALRQVLVGELLDESDLLRLLVGDGPAHADDLLLQIVVAELQLEVLLVVFAQTSDNGGDLGDKAGCDFGCGGHARGCD